MARTAPTPPPERLLPPPTRRPAPDFSLATVNIVLLLVLFFLVAGTIVAVTEQGIELPETVDLPLAELPRPLIVLAVDGTTALDGEVLGMAAILDRLAAEGAEQVYLLTARETPALRLLETLAVLEPAGITSSLVTLRNRTPLAAPEAAEVAP